METIYMMSCLDYKIIPGSEVATLSEAVDACARIETERNDGYAVVAARHGRLVADAEGVWGERHLSAYEMACGAIGCPD